MNNSNKLNERTIQQNNESKDRERNRNNSIDKEEKKTTKQSLNEEKPIDSQSTIPNFNSNVQMNESTLNTSNIIEAMKDTKKGVVTKDTFSNIIQDLNNEIKNPKKKNKKNKNNLKGLNGLNLDDNKKKNRIL